MSMDMSMEELVGTCKLQVNKALAQAGGDEDAVRKAIEAQLGPEPAGDCASTYSFWVVSGQYVVLVQC